MSRYYRNYVEVSLKAIEHNLDESIARVNPGTRICAVVKANAYGHGACRVAKDLESRADFFAVATLDEGLELRDAGVEKPILCLGYISPSGYPEMIRAQIRPSIYREEEAEALEKAAEKEDTAAKFHFALDTGMSRIGFQVTEEDADVMARIAGLPHLEAEGLFTHLSCCDQQDQTYTKEQYKKYDRMLAMLEERNVKIPIRHVDNSAAVEEFDADEPHHYDMVRIGITQYGCYPSEEVNKKNLDLIPALSWRAHVVHVKDVGPGVGVGYGATYVTSRPVTRIATVSAGYADGYPRALSGKGRVLIHGKSAPILGRICMDMMMVDVTDIPDVAVEDVVTLVGRDGDECIPIEEIADASARFNYEMLCDISPRVTRIYDK